MRALGVFRDWTGPDSPLGIYTKQTSNNVPATDGCYAWFLPIWLYDSDLEELLHSVDQVLRHNPSPERHTSVPFKWDRIDLTANRVSRVTAARRKRKETWDALVADPEGREALQHTLLSTSLLMPPLYVGRTNNLQKRYVQHVEGRGEGSTFYERFTECAGQAGLSVSVGDLLFVCVRSNPALARLVPEDSELEKLLEYVLMQICHPPFSLR